MWEQRIYIIIAAKRQQKGGLHTGYSSNQTIPLFHQLYYLVTNF
jgi:hypothetical protein